MSESKRRLRIWRCFQLATAILFILGRQAVAGDLAQIKVQQVSASSDGTEDPVKWPHSRRMAIDGDTKTCWASSNKDLVGAWLKFDFGAKKKVSQVQIINGWIPRGFPDFFKQNYRAKKITLRYDNGKEESFDLKDNNDVQVLFPTLANETQSVTLRVDALYPASSADKPWITISEVSFFSPN